MPEISRFSGILIAMYYAEHNPPHFHVRHNEYKASISFKDLALVTGNQQELMDDWELAEQLQVLRPIKPLE